MTKKSVATLMTMMAMAAVPAAVAPIAQAEVCGGIGGRYVDVGGCTNIARDLAVGPLLADERYGFAVAYPIALEPAFRGELPCISPAGLPYYTPGEMPCY